MHSSMEAFNSNAAMQTYKNSDLETFEKRNYLSATRRYSPYDVPNYRSTYSSLDNQDVLKTFQNSYERLRSDANGILPEKRSCSDQYSCKDALTCSEKVIETRADVIENSNENRDNSLSYIGMIATAILRSPETKLTLAGIYTYMEKHFYGILSNRPGWRNTVRHNLSLHECFVKGEIAAEGKGRFWRIHPNYFEQFKCGKFNKNILQSSVPMFYRSLGNYRIPTPREQLPLSSFYPGSTWAPAFYPLISPSYPYPALPFSQSALPPPSTEKIHRVDAFRSCSSDCCTSCPVGRQLPTVHRSSYRIPPQTLPIEDSQITLLQ